MKAEASPENPITHLYSVNAYYKELKFLLQVMVKLSPTSLTIICTKCVTVWFWPISLQGLLFIACYAIWLVITVFFQILDWFCNIKRAGMDNRIMLQPQQSSLQVTRIKVWIIVAGNVLFLPLKYTHTKKKLNVTLLDEWKLIWHSCTSCHNVFLILIFQSDTVHWIKLVHSYPWSAWKTYLAWIKNCLPYWIKV